MAISKVTENRLRRVAKRQGFTLHKNPARDERAVGYGMYQLRSAFSVRSDIIPGQWYDATAVANLLGEIIE